MTRTNAAERARRRDRAASASTIQEEGAHLIVRTREDAEALVDMDVAVEEVESTPTSSDRDDEIGSLARELGRGQRELIDQFQRYAGMEAAEAARTPRDHALERVRTAPPDQLSWSTLAQAVLILSARPKTSN